MTKTEILAVAALAFAASPMVSFLGAAGAMMGSQGTDARDRLSRTAYAIRMVVLIALQTAIFIMLPSSSQFHVHGKGAGVVWLFTLVLGGKWSAQRLNDAGILKHTLAVLTGIPIFGLFVMARLAMLPSVPPPQDPNP